MQVIATAGHVDHGKSTLVTALTGMQPDRLREERRRGLTIDLGFAWHTTESGTEVAFVDVPGHERFVPNMLAGVGPVPAALFVVAADEGWMPQSAEHLAALDALGVRHGLLVLTRADLADPAPARAAATAELADSTLRGAAAVTVSARTGDGLPQLRTALDRLAAALPAPDPAADVRLWVDRAFTIAGAGTVVTGTLGAGTLHTGDELELAGTGERVTVRTLEALGTRRSSVTGTARVALNLRGVDRDRIHRGDALLTPGSVAGGQVLDVCPGVADLPGTLTVHCGSAAVAATTRPLGADAVRLTLARPLPVRHGDRLLLRDPGRHRVLAGVDVVAVDPPPLRRRGAARRRGVDLAAAHTPADAAALLLREHIILTAAQFHRAGLPVTGRRFGDRYVDPGHVDQVAGALPRLLADWLAAHPLDRGAPIAALAARAGVPAPVLTALLPGTGLHTADGLVRQQDRGLPPTVEAAVHTVITDLAADPFQAPETERLRELGLGTRELAAAAAAGRLLVLDGGVVLAPGAADTAAAALARLDQPFTVAAARTALASTRRITVPLLEHLDARGLTVRHRDNTRTAVLR